ncbi:MAG: hypothetical protein GWO86_00980 [Planctomycetes bacterium]|nr:hypothetical protein [Planctomycetota bacterium]
MRDAAAVLVVVVAGLLVCTNTLVAEEVPFEALWAGSGHADANSEAFTHWDNDNPAVIPTRCAKCHSTPGYLDFIGEDGTAAGTVENEPNVGTVITCVACHNDAAIAMEDVNFPSDIEITGLDGEARCMQCHQGRESGASVDDEIADANVAGDDDPNASLGFKNIHYFAAAATQFAGEVKGGYQYDGKSYDARFTHVESLDSCISCHDQHSLEVKVTACADCHTGVANAEDLKDVRMNGSESDYDGDGDVSEGIYHEIAGLQDILYPAIQAYAATTGVYIVYDPNSYPYFFIDTNQNGLVDSGENIYPNKYKPWTPRLLKAAYNYQVSVKDPGAFAHNAKYIIQLLYDSIDDLNPTLVTGLQRNDAGHFAGSEDPFRHWDDKSAIPANCSKCHSAAGLPLFLDQEVTVSQPIGNGLMCTTCHDSMPAFTRYDAAGAVEFPSGAELDMGDSDNNLCIECHQGRESTVSVNDAVAGLEADTVSTSLGFKNIHYLPAGATLFGSGAKGAYEYMGKAYNGRFLHTSSRDTCTECHDTHKLEIKPNGCGCHGSGINPEDIRGWGNSDDYDGDGNISEGFAGEIQTLYEVLYTAIQSYATAISGVDIVYDSGSYPYFFIDTNGNGSVDPGENIYPNKYNAWTPRLLEAAYNYQYAMKEPGAFAHNGKYFIQVLYDSLASLNAKVSVSMTGMVRPNAEGAVEACGDATHPYPQGDLNQDCVVDGRDLARFGINWLQDSNP